MPYKDPKPKLDIGRLDHLVTAAVSDISALSLLPIGMFSNATLLNLSELHTDDGDDDDVGLMEATEVPSCVSSHLKHARVLRDVVIRTAYESEEYKGKLNQVFVSSIRPENCRLSVDVDLTGEFEL